MSEDVGDSTRTSAMVNESEFLFAERNEQELGIFYREGRSKEMSRCVQKHKNISDPMAAARMTPT